MPDSTIPFQHSHILLTRKIENSFIFTARQTIQIKIGQDISVSIHTSSNVGNTLAETIWGAPQGTLTQLFKPASSTESLSISPST